MGLRRTIHGEEIDGVEGGGGRETWKYNKSNRYGKARWPMTVLYYSIDAQYECE